VEQGAIAGREGALKARLTFCSQQVARQKPLEQKRVAALRRHCWGPR
jgi:hypothetical protein